MVSSETTLPDVAMQEDKVASVKVEEEERPGSPHEAASHGGGYSSDSSAEPVDVSKLDPETLQARIKAQVEYYFSQHNLNKDAYMISQMNSDGFIAVATIASFKKVRHLTTDLELIVRAISDSSVCELNEDKSMLKTSWRRPARTTIILRDVHDSATEEEIKGLFEGTSFTMVSARSDVGQTWFVTMATEEDAKSAVLHLLGKTMHGQPVKARLKSETLRPTVAPFTPAGLTADGQQQGVQYPYNAYQAGYGYWQPGMHAQYADPSQGGRGQRQKGSGGKRMGDRSMDKRAGRGGAAGSFANGPRGAGRRDGGGRQGDRGSDSVTLTPGIVRKGGGKKTQQKKAQPVSTPVFQPQDFPSLSMGKLSLDEDTKVTEEEPAPPSADQVEKTIEAPGQALSAEVGLNSAENDTGKPVSSWVAALAKTRAPEAPTATSSTASTQPEAAVAEPTSSNTNQRDVEAKVEVQKPSAPQTSEPKSSQAQQPQLVQVDRPKRGWEKPGVVPKGSKAEKNTAESDNAKVVSCAASTGSEMSSVSVSGTASSSAATTVSAEDTVQDNVTKPAAEASEASSSEDNRLLTTAFGAWGQKKSFLDVIKTPTSDDAPANPSAPKPAAATTAKEGKLSAAAAAGAAATAAAPVANREGSAAFAKDRVDPANSLEGNWRSAIRRKPTPGSQAATK